MISFLKNFLFRDFWLKLFSLVLAVLIWLAVSFAIHRDLPPEAPLENLTLAEKIFANIPVVVMASAADVHGFKVDHSEVTVKVRGDTKTLEHLQASDIRAIVDLTGIESAKGLKKKIAVTTPANISYVSVEPDEVEVIVPPKR